MIPKHLWLRRVRVEKRLSASDAALRGRAISGLEVGFSYTGRAPGRQNRQFPIRLFTRRGPKGQSQRVKITAMVRKFLLLGSSLIIWVTWAQTSKPSSIRPVGDGGPAVNASINGPSGLAIDGDTLYVIESFGNFIRRVDLATGIITTVRTQTPLEAIDSITVDPKGDLIVTEFTVDRVRKIHPQDGTVTTVAGRVKLKFSGDGGPATRAGLFRPNYTAFDAKGNLLIVDMGNNRIRRVDAESGSISTVAGGGKQSSTGDGGPALQAGLEYPNSVVVDSAGNFFIAQFGYGQYICRWRRKRGPVWRVKRGQRCGYAMDFGSAIKS